MKPTFQNDPLLAFWRLLHSLRTEDVGGREASLRTLTKLGFYVKVREESAVTAATKAAGNFTTAIEDLGRGPEPDSLEQTAPNDGLRNVSASLHPTTGEEGRVREAHDITPGEDHE